MYASTPVRGVSKTHTSRLPSIRLLVIISRLKRLMRNFDAWPLATTLLSML
nr:MAG TPA: hypothetical protein [Caudoviricetes sp.]